MAPTYSWRRRWARAIARRGRPPEPPTPNALDPKSYEDLALGFVNRYANFHKRDFAGRLADWDDMRQQLWEAAWHELENICRRAPKLERVTPLEYVAARLKALLYPSKGRSGRFRAIKLRTLGIRHPRSPEKAAAELKTLDERYQDLSGQLRTVEKQHKNTLFHLTTTYDALTDLRSFWGREFPLIQVEGVHVTGRHSTTNTKGGPMSPAMSATTSPTRTNTADHDPDRVLVEAKKLAQRHGLHWSNELDREICVTLVLGAAQPA